MEYSTKLKWAKFILCFAAAYNLFWGALISIYPQIILFDNTESTFMLIVLKCIGMLVGVYGIAYYFASLDPQKYWPLIMVGFMGKVLGPIGAVYYVLLKEMQPGFLMVNVFNDLIWLFPFGWILYQVLTGALSAQQIDDGRTLYQKLLGTEFSRLSPNLKRFHGSTTAVQALGEFKVTRGSNTIGNMFAKIADLPNSIDVAEAELIVHPTSAEEIWSRRINDKKVISKQWLKNEFLVERFKVVKIYLHAQVQNGDLIIADVASTVFGISMPPFFTPTVLAIGRDVEDGVLVNVEIGFKPFGRIINYIGVVRISEIEH